MLKYGSMIVDNLRVFKQPVFVYLPYNAEVRGGAWVVVETAINPEKIEMYAAGEPLPDVLAYHPPPSAVDGIGLRFPSASLISAPLKPPLSSPKIPLSSSDHVQNQPPHSADHTGTLH